MPSGFLRLVKRVRSARFHRTRGIGSSGCCVTAIAGERVWCFMPVAVGDIVRITAKMLLSGIGDIVNVFHFSVAIDTAPNDTQFMLDTALLIDILYGTINLDVHLNVGYSSVEGQNISKNELLPSTPFPTLVVGANATEMLPEMVAACVFHRTLTPRVRASKFLPPYAESANIDGALNPATATRCQTFGDSLTAGLAGARVSLVYVAFNRTLMTSTVVTQALVPSRFRTQRNRRLGVGS